MRTVRAIWMAGLKKILDTASSVVRDTIESDTEKLEESLERFRDEIERVKDDVDHDDWPDSWQTDIARSIDQIDTWVDGGFLAHAVSLASTIVDTLTLRGARYERISGQMQMLEGRRAAARRRLDELRGDDPSDAWTDLDNRLGAASRDLGTATTAWARGDADFVEPLLPKLAGEISEIYTEAKMLPFLESKTLDLVQASFKTEGSDVPLLRQLENAGVCQALVLDWLALGGSKSPPGTVVEGRITSKHLTWQTQGQLDDELITSIRELSMGQKSPPGPSEEASSYVEPARRVLGDLEAASRTVDERIGELELQVSDTSDRLRTAFELAEERGEHPDPWESDPELTELQAQLAEVKQEKADLPGRILAQTLLVSQLEALARGETGSDGIDPLELDIGELRKKLEGAMEARRRDEQRRKRLSGTGGPELPSATLKALGMGHDPRDASVTERLDDHDTLTGDQVEAFLRGLIEPVPKGETWSWEIGLNLPEGHACAARVTQASLVKALDIELFDPNIGAYRFDDADRAVACFRAWFEEVYRGCWVRVQGKKLRVLPKDEDDVRTDDLLVSGRSLGDTYALDREKVADIVGRVDDLPGMPKRVRQVAARMLARADALAKAMTARIDLKVAQGALQNTYDLCVSAIEDHTRCVVLEAELRRRLRPRDTHHAVPKGHYDAALELHRAGELQAAKDRYTKARNSLDLIEAELELLRSEDIEV